MLDHTQDNKNSLRYPLNHYHGKFNPENLVFDANLQEFTQQVVYIVGLETSGKILPEEAYKQIQQLWEQITISKHELRIGTNSNV